MTAALPYLEYDAATRRLRLDPHEPAFVQDPYAAYRFLHQQGSIFFWEDYGIWCLGGYEDVNRTLRDRRLGRQKPAGSADSIGNPGERRHLLDFDAVEANSLLELEPPVHTRLRTLVNRAFVSRQVERLRPRIEALSNDLVDEFPSGDVDLLPAFAAPIPITVIAEMLGVPVEMGPQLLDWSHRMVAMYMHGRSRTAEESANEAAREFASFLRGYVQDRRRKPGDDLLSLLIAAQDGGQKLSEDELVSSVILLLNAGHEATVHQTGNAVRAILTAGADPRHLFASAEATAATVEECLRFDAPLHMFTRYAYETIDLGKGAVLKPGEQVGLMLGMANRDPLAFAEPNRFDPTRSDQKNVSFGAGIHFCIGAPLARLELQAGLKVLFERLPNLSLAAEPAYRDTYHFHGLERLPVRAS
jgi:cytochrome P450